MTGRRIAAGWLSALNISDDTGEAIGGGVPSMRLAPPVALHPYVAANAQDHRGGRITRL